MASNEECLNYAELAKVVIDVGTEILRDILNREITPNKIRKQMHQSSGKKIKLSGEQWESINHAPTYGYTHFDISLLYMLLSQISSLNIQPPTHGWGLNILPEPSEQTIGDDIERIRLTKLFLIQHIRNKTMSNDDFRKYSQVLKEVAGRMKSRFGGNYTQTISVIFQGSSTQQELDESVSQIENMDSDTENETNTTTGPSSSTIVKSTALPDENKNYIRLATLCFEYGTKCVRSVFDKYFPPAQLFTKLQAKQKELFSSKKMTKAQLDILFPRQVVPVGMVSAAFAAPKPTSAKFDVSLMINLLRSISTIQQPVKGWFGKPDDTDVSEAADICRIRECRNLIAHNIEGKLNIVEFKTNWKEIKKAINRIAGNIYRADMKHLKVMSLDGTDRNEEVKDLHKQIEACKREIQDMKSIIPEPIKDLHGRMVSGWKEEDNVFMETVASASVFNATKKKNVVTVTGNFGTGKSAIVHHCALKLEKEGYSVHPVCTPTDILEFYNPTEKQVFVIDDPLGKYNLDYDMFLTWNRHETRLQTCLSSGITKILFSVRKLILNDSFLKSEETVLCENIVDLQEEKFVLSKQARLKMLKTHLNHQHVSISQGIISTIASSPIIEHFPLCCRLFASNSSFQKEGASFFQNSFHFLQRDIEKLKLQNKKQYCALVLCAFKYLSDDFCNVHKVSASDKYIIQTFMEACGVESSVPLIEIKRAAESLQHVYLKVECNSYVFIHDIISDSVLYHYGQDYPEQVLKYCTRGFLKYHIRLLPQDSNTDISREKGHVIYIAEHCYDTFVDRLLVEIEHGFYFDVFSLSCMNDELFMRYFCENLTQKGHEFIVNLFRENITQHVDSSYKENTYIELPTMKINLQATIFFWLANLRVGPMRWIIATGNNILFQFLYERIIRDENNISLKINLLVTSVLSDSTIAFDYITQDAKLMDNDEFNKLDVLNNCLIASCFFKNSEIYKKLINLGADIRCAIRNYSMMYSFIEKNDLILSLKKVFLKEFYRHDMLPFLNNQEFLSDKQFSVLTMKNNVGEISCAGHTLQFSRIAFPLLMASLNGNQDIVESILQLDTDEISSTCNATAAVLLASIAGHHDVVETLIQHNADINMCDKNGNYLFQLACIFGHTKVVELFIQHNVDINRCDNKGISPVSYASFCGHYDVSDVLIKHNADINRCNNCGVSPLCSAITNGHLDAVELLIKHNADINKCDNDGLSPVAVASEKGYHEVVNLLIQHNADIEKCHINGASPLYIASQNGHLNVVELLIKHTANINKCTKNGFTPVAAASEKGYHEVVNVLIQHNADIEKCNINGASPLFIASQNGHLDVVELLIKHKADIDKCTNNDVSPIYTASLNGHIDVVNVLIKHNADINKCNKNGFTPVAVASEKGHHEVVNVLIQHNADIEKCNINGASPLLIASQNGHLDVVELLIKHNADINKCNKNGFTPVAVASEKGHHGVVNVLIQHNADMEKCNINGASPLFIASQNGHLDVVELLIKHNADINKCKKDGFTPVAVASEKGHHGVVNVLIQHNADIEKCNINGASPLFIASQNGHLDVVELLIKHKADIDKCTNNDVSPIYTASLNGHIDVVNVLIKHNADINKCNKNGFSPVAVASEKGYHEIVNVLIQHNADIEKCNINGASPLFIASQNGHLNVVKELIQHKADIEKCTNYDVSPVYMASQNGHLGVVELLIKHNADIDKCSCKGESPVYVAAEVGHIDVVEVLLQHNADIIKCDNNGVSPVHIASQNGHYNIVDLLTLLQADINKCDKYGQSPIISASYKGHLEIVKLLIQHTADISKCSDDNTSALSVASDSGYYDIVEVLIQNNADINACDMDCRFPIHFASLNGHCNVVELLVQNGAKLNVFDITGNSPLSLALTNHKYKVVIHLLRLGARISEFKVCYSEPRYSVLYSRSDAI